MSLRWGQCTSEMALLARDTPEFGSQQQSRAHTSAPDVLAPIGARGGDFKGGWRSNR